MSIGCVCGLTCSTGMIGTTAYAALCSEKGAGEHCEVLASLEAAARRALASLHSARRAIPPTKDTPITLNLCEASHVRRREKAEKRLGEERVSASHRTAESERDGRRHVRWRRSLRHRSTFADRLGVRLQRGACVQALDCAEHRKAAGRASESVRRCSKSALSGPSLAHSRHPEPSRGRNTVALP